jgi:hypothetical protein
VPEREGGGARCICRTQERGDRGILSLASLTAPKTATALSTPFRASSCANSSPRSVRECP